jgi:hypothetical protein
MDATGNGWVSDAIRCWEYCLSKDTHVLSNSWGGVDYSQSLQARFLSWQASHTEQHGTTAIQGQLQLARMQAVCMSCSERSTYMFHLRILVSRAALDVWKAQMTESGINPGSANALRHAQNALNELSARGALVVASAGNDGMDTDTTPHYPSSLPDDVILSVGASTRQNALWCVGRSFLAHIILVLVSYVSHVKLIQKAALPILAARLGHFLCGRLHPPERPVVRGSIHSTQHHTLNSVRKTWTHLLVWFASWMHHLPAGRCCISG